VDLDGTAILIVNGLFDIYNDRYWDHANGAVGTLTVTNNGTVRKSAGAGDFRFFDTTFNNPGTVTVLTGRILVNGVPL
jgi:hypothetical protein